MGMFDYVRCDAPLPDAWVPSEMQTKSFDCVMTTLWIKADGTLWEDRGSYVLGDRREPAEWVQLDFHGWCSFYGSEDPANHRGGSKHQNGKRTDMAGNPLPPLIWHEYNAKFTDGRLMEIKTDTRKN